MIRSLANKTPLKEHLYTVSMVEGTYIQNHLDEFNSIIYDLESLDVKIKDKDEGILLVVSLFTFYRHFKDIPSYSNNEDVSFEDVRANLLSKEKFDLKVRDEKGQRLLVIGESFDEGSTSK